MEKVSFDTDTKSQDSHANLILLDPVEYVLGIIKILACAGFIIFGIIVDCGGVPGDKRGYIGAKYWHDPGAFRSVFFFLQGEMSSPTLIYVLQTRIQRILLRLRDCCLCLRWY